MKKLIVLLMMCFYIFFVNAQVYTPNGSLVPDAGVYPEYLTPYDISYILQVVAAQYPNATVIGQPTSTYNCHAYAWHVSEGGSPVWMGANTNPTPIYWNDGSYIETTSTSNGLKVSYANPPYSAYDDDNHSAITTEAEGVFISKWGAWTLMRHAKDYCPYNSSRLHYFKRNTPSPHPIDLLIRDDNQDDGEEPNPRSIFWNSPDIKLLDFFTFSAITNLDEYPYSECYINVDIKNIGPVNIKGDGTERLHLFWQKPILISRFFFGSFFTYNVGGRITSPQGEPISCFNQAEQLISAGIIRFKLPDNNPYRGILQLAFIKPFRFNWGFSIMAIADEGVGGIPELANITPRSDWAALAKKYNSIAVMGGNRLLIGKDFSNIVEIAPALQRPFSLRVEQLLKNDKYVLNDFAELNVLLSNDLIEKLDFQKSGVKQIDENTVYLPSAKMELFFYPLDNENGLYFAGTEVNFISDKMPEYNDFDFDFSLLTDGEIDETMRITAIDTNYCT